MCSEFLRVSYNMYLANTLALLAKRLCEDPEMVNETVSTLIKAKSSEAMDKGLSTIGIHIKQLEDDAKGEKTCKILMRLKYCRRSISYRIFVSLLLIFYLSFKGPKLPLQNLLQNCCLEFSLIKPTPCGYFNRWAFFLLKK